MGNKFEIKDSRSFAKRLSATAQSALFWKGRKKGMVTTMNIRWSHIRAVFFPKNFYEKYQYLGSIPYNEEGALFKAMEPLIIFMDYQAKPKWCPRWFLRLLHLFGSDNSIVRVRNFRLHNLFRRLTKGIQLTDWKTKWEWYDLRISVHANEQINDLADMIESHFYRQGQRSDMMEELEALDPGNQFYGTNSQLKALIDKLQQQKEDNEKI
jgi:hypothetical protein